MAVHRYTLLDVFTANPLEGNALAVVHDADDVHEQTMLAFARETKLSETTFVQTATHEGADYRNRIWTVEHELPFAGHPSLGTAVAVARARGADGEVSFVQQTEVGLQPIDVRLDGDHAAYASMLQNTPVHGPQVDNERALAALGLTAEDADPELPAQVVSTGIPQLILPLRDKEAAGRVRPDYDAITDVLGEHGAVTLYAAACTPDAEQGHAHARSFAFSADIGEDPATGSAAGPLCAYLHAHTGTPRLTVDQGCEMGRPSRLDTAVEGDRIRVGGHVVVLVDGTLRF